MFSFTDGLVPDHQDTINQDDLSRKRGVVNGMKIF